MSDTFMFFLQEIWLYMLCCCCAAGCFLTAMNLHYWTLWSIVVRVLEIFKGYTLQVTPASSTWPQLVLPQPENLHWWIVSSVPTQATSSIHIRPVPSETKIEKNTFIYTCLWRSQSKTITMMIDKEHATFLYTSSK